MAEMESAGTAGVPDAPFKTTWPELSLKRMIRWAAENGYDRIAWTPGEVQADRYDLSKQVDEISYRKNADGTYNVGAHKGDTTVWSDGAATEKVLEDTIGKEPTKKIVESATSKNQVMRGLDLRFGGEGMRGFYDKILVDAANKLGKRFGAKVGRTRIESSPADFQERYDGAAQQGRQSEMTKLEKERALRPVHSLDITPQNRQIHREGKG